MTRNVALYAILVLTAFSSFSCVREGNVVLELDSDVAPTADKEANISDRETNNIILTKTTADAPNEWNLESHYDVSEAFELFDGNTLDGWIDARGGAPKGWIVEDNILRLVNPENGNDIITSQSFDSFIFTFEWRLGRGCNSGVKYKIERSENGWIGLEYQIQDDANVEDGIINDRKIASLFDVLPAVPSSKAGDYPLPTEIAPIGDFRQGKIIVAGSHVEHWLDDECVLRFEIGSSEWNDAKRDSKFKNRQNFGLVESSPILLQCHGHPVDFRNLKIQKLRPVSGN